jgi:hypothetical protein
MVHAALLLLMLEAANARPRFTISLKRSTQNLQLSTSSPADYPIFWPKADTPTAEIRVRFRVQSGHDSPKRARQLLTRSGHQAAQDLCRANCP